MATSDEIYQAIEWTKRDRELSYKGFSKEERTAMAVACKGCCARQPRYSNWNGTGFWHGEYVAGFLDCGPQHRGACEAGFALQWAAFLKIPVYELI